ncbi:unnamed protein product [Pseudo-nitzschia multistriata]|uniref:Leucine-rich repeat-containing N-terminal plant-type domain-containing protein n=1 Tax=Pseudo-nitzschia multistriata TaxID=183589 RepID=A0A448ZQ23_9STRA|nr:unnamed protein product [Pseudo-nitzschia multistriata]
MEDNGNPTRMTKYLFHSSSQAEDVALSSDQQAVSDAQEREMNKSTQYLTLRTNSKTTSPSSRGRTSAPASQRRLYSGATYTRDKPTAAQSITYEDNEEQLETKSMKLKRILYGSLSSSSLEKSVRLPSSSSVNSNFNKKTKQVERKGGSQEHELSYQHQAVIATATSSTKKFTDGHGRPYIDRNSTRNTDSQSSDSRRHRTTQNRCSAETRALRRSEEQRNTKMMLVKPRGDVAESTPNITVESKLLESSTTDSGMLHSFTRGSKLDNKNKIEKKESMARKKIIDRRSEKSNLGNNNMGDEFCWMPPALTNPICSDYRYDRPTAESKRKKDPDARDSTGEEKPKSKPFFGTSTLQNDKKSKPDVMKYQSQENLVDKIPPVFEVTLTVPLDDDSTLGTEGTYLDRFPKKNKRSQEKQRKKIKTQQNEAIIIQEAATDQPKPHAMDSWLPGGVQSTNYEPEIPFKETEKKKRHSQQSSSLRKNILEVPGNSDYKHIKNIVSSTTKASWNNAIQRDDPPANEYMFPYDPKKLYHQQVLPGQSDSVDVDTFHDDSFEHYYSSELGNTPETSIAGSHNPQQYVLSSARPLTSWVPPSMEGQGDAVDLNPTRIYVNSIMTKKRSRSYINSLIAKKRSCLPLSHSAVFAQRSSGEPHDNETTDPSQLSANFPDEVGGITVSGNSAPPSNPTIHSRSSKKSFEDPEISTSEYSQNTSREGSSLSKRSGKVHDTEQGWETSQSTDVVMPRPCTTSSSPWSAVKESSKKGFQSDSYKGGRKMIILICLFSVLVVAGAIVVVVLWKLGILFDDSTSQPEPNEFSTPTSISPTTTSTQAPSMAPVIRDNPSAFAPSQNYSSSPINVPLVEESERGTDLFNLVVDAYPQGRAALQAPDSPQGKALQWLLESTVNGETFIDERVLQRYVLATIYYSTNGDEWTNNTAWLSELDECEWWSTAEKVCDEFGRYRKLDLQENNLVGSLPSELVILSNSLMTINVRDNALSGQLPSLLVADLTNLEVLDLSSNAFSGELSPRLFDARKLTRLSLFENMLSSFIPADLGKLTELYVLDFGSNKLTSTIPTEVGKLSKLTGLSLFNNMLSGAIPTEILELQNLNMLYIDSNNFEANVPEEVCLIDLEEFWSDCEEIQCTCCTTCCSDNFGCFAAL